MASPALDVNRTLSDKTQVDLIVAWLLASNHSLAVKIRKELRQRQTNRPTMWQTKTMRSHLFDPNTDVAQIIREYMAHRHT